MNGDTNHSLGQLPEEMFTLIKTSSQSLGPRLGRLSLAGRKQIETPHYLANTSRGVVPHITQDTFRRDTHISGAYYALEDFIERAPLEGPPLYQFNPPNGGSPLRKFTALPDETCLVLGARRTDPILAPAANSNTSHAVSICTSVGFQQLKAGDYAEAVERLRVDIVVGLGDIPYGREHLGKNRVAKAEDRSTQWLENHVAARKKVETGKAHLFASLLPLPCARQVSLIEFVAEELDDEVSGLAMFHMDTLDDLPESLTHLPRLDFSVPQTPLDVLKHIRRGMDVLTIPFIGTVTDAGIAMDFTFPATKKLSNGHTYADPLSLGVDMWDATHAVDLSPLSKGCQCYACTNHHRAYVQHLLAAKEMLGWVLLQIHNHHTMDLFFAGVRTSIAQGTFDEDVLQFERTYESHLPEKTGQGPRLRGYQFKSEGPGEAKKNQIAFTMLNDQKEKVAEAILPNRNANAQDLEAQGFAEKA